jgi:hypothetical protein
LIDEARARLASRDVVAARLAVDGVFAADPTHPDLSGLQDACLALEREMTSQWDRLELDRQAASVVEQAERRFATGDPAGAIEQLTSYSPPHPLVERALNAMNERRYELARLGEGPEAGALPDAQELASIDDERLAFVSWAQQQCARAEEAMRASRWDDALHLLIGLQSRYPDYPDLVPLLERARRGAVQTRQDQRTHDEAARSVLRHAETVFKSGRPTEAMALLTSFEPGHPLIERTLREWQHVVEAVPQEPAHQRPRPPSATPLPSSRLATDTASTLVQRVEGHLRAAREALARSDLHQSRLQVDNALRIDPRSAAAHALRHELERRGTTRTAGTLLARLGELDKGALAAVALALLTLMLVVAARNC